MLRRAVGVPCVTGPGYLGTAGWIWTQCHKEVTGLGGLRDTQVASLQNPPSEATQQPRPGPPCSSGHCHLSPVCRALSDLTLTRDQWGLQVPSHPSPPPPTQHSTLQDRCPQPGALLGGPGRGSDEGDRAQARGRPARGPMGDPLSADAVRPAAPEPLAVPAGRCAQEGPPRPVPAPPA